MNKTETDPHFEFRIFGQDLGHIAESIMALSPVKAQDEGAQTYILSTTNQVYTQVYNVKIRNDKLDMKVLLRHERGLERWLPYLQIPFPLTSAFLHEFLFAWLEVEPPPLLRASYNAHQLLHELVMPNPRLCPVQIYKQRRHYTVNGCQVEIASLLINARQPLDTILDTIAVEAVEADRVLSTLESLGIDDADNTNYLVGLHQLFGQAGAQKRVIAARNGSIQPVSRPELVFAG